MNNFIVNILFLNIFYFSNTDLFSVVKVASNIKTIIPENYFILHALYIK